MMSSLHPRSSQPTPLLMSVPEYESFLSFNRDGNGPAVDIAQSVQEQ